MRSELENGSCNSQSQPAAAPTLFSVQSLRVPGPFLVGYASLRSFVDVERQAFRAVLPSGGFAAWPNLFQFLRVPADELQEAVENK